MAVLNTKVPYEPDDEPFAMFHWSPSERRASITKLGLVPGRISTCRQWRPPYVAFALDPLMAWQLSGGQRNREPQYPFWDLWQVWSHIPNGIETITDTYVDMGRPYVKELRVYERIFKRDVWHVATRCT